MRNLEKALRRGIVTEVLVARLALDQLFRESVNAVLSELGNVL